MRFGGSLIIIILSFESFPLYPTKARLLMQLPSELAPYQKIIYEPKHLKANLHLRKLVEVRCKNHRGPCQKATTFKEWHLLHFRSTQSSGLNGNNIKMYPPRPFFPPLPSHSPPQPAHIHSTAWFSPEQPTLHSCHLSLRMTGTHKPFWKGFVGYRKKKQLWLSEVKTKQKLGVTKGTRPCFLQQPFRQLQSDGLEGRMSEATYRRGYPAGCTAALTDPGALGHLLSALLSSNHRRKSQEKIP